MIQIVLTNADDGPEGGALASLQRIKQTLDRKRAHGFDEYLESFIELSECGGPVRGRIHRR